MAERTPAVGNATSGAGEGYSLKDFGISLSDISPPEEDDIEITIDDIYVKTPTWTTHDFDFCKKCTLPRGFELLRDDIKLDLLEKFLKCERQRIKTKCESKAATTGGEWESFSLHAHWRL